MKQILQEWFQRNFSDPQAVILALMLVFGFGVVMVMGKILAPLLASIIIAYLLEGAITKLEKLGVRRMLVVLLVFVMFLLVLFTLVLGLIPLLSRQIAQLVREMPNMISKGQEVLLQLPLNYPNLISETQIKEVINALRSQILEQGQDVLTQGLLSLPGIISLLIYLILVPFLVFFFLKDKHVIVAWAKNYLPRRRELVTRVWQEMDLQIGNYVRGKILEIVIVGGVSYIAFAIFGMRYSMLLGALVGMSVLVPYIGAVVVTFPVVLIAYFQWGNSNEFWYLILTYTIIQSLDGNVLVPLLFSEAVNLHPLAIIVAVLFFGGIWGMWGIFFAIPLATLVKAVLNAWPRPTMSTTESVPSG